MTARKERRNASAYRLRVYLEEIKTLEGLTDDSYIDHWVATATADTAWISRTALLDRLRLCAITEAQRLTGINRNAA